MIGARWLPFAGLLTVAAALGLWWGLRAIPPGETEIITGVAAEYAAETGGAMTDCFARPADLEGVRLVVICNAEDRAPWLRAVDTYGARVEIDPALLEEEPQT